MTSSDNPSVNRYLTNKDMDAIDHALGRPLDPQRESFRNHYAASANTFVGNPHWKVMGRDGDMTFWCVTHLGRAALASHLKAIGDKHRRYEITFRGYRWFQVAVSAAKAKYAAFLSVSEPEPDITFGEFVAGVKVRPA